MLLLKQSGGTICGHKLGTKPILSAGRQAGQSPGWIRIGNQAAPPARPLSPLQGRSPAEYEALSL